MKRFLPQSLFGQTVLVLVAGLLVSMFAGSWIYSTDREQAVRAVGGFAAAERIANLSRLVRDAPADLRPRIVAGLSDRGFTVRLAPRPLAGERDDDESGVAVTIRDYLIEELALTSGPAPRVAAARGYAPPGFGQMMHRGPPDHVRERERDRFGGPGAFRSLRASVPLPDGQWLTFTTSLPEAGLSFSHQFMLSMALMALTIFAVSAWAVRRVTAPLATLAGAAERLGRDVNAPPLPETGSTETRQASRAFNDMQVRLRNLIENRTRLLAGISHDLRTPLTLLRLRAEGVENAQERERMLATIAEMDAMVGATLNFARDESVSETRKPTDIAALAQSIADDMSDAGMDVSMESSGSVVCDARPAALKRALTNLVENAVKYGHRARIAVTQTAKEVEINVDDDGPGIPDAELKKVFEPFYRVEASRNQETGGVGLGLAIAQSAVQAHGGDLILANRAGGGLRATIRLAR
jgi:signal transduction histidine kinase